MKSPIVAANPVLLWILGGASVSGILLLLIFIFQIQGLFQNYAYYVTTGSESLPVYSIWEVQEGHLLYQWPFKDYYQLTLYNFGFYYAYAFILDLLNAHGPKILLYGRLLTAFFSLIGVFVQVRLLKAALFRPLHGLEEATIWILSFCTWFNSHLPGYYDLSVRPDVLAVIFCILATLFFIKYIHGQKWKWLVLAVLAWIFAWCLKQTAVFSLIGACSYLFFFRRWKALAFLLLGYGFFTASILYFGSPEYRWNILTAPLAEPFLFSVKAQILFQGIALSLFSWSALLTFPLLLKFESKRSEAAFRGLVDRMRPGGDLSAIAALTCMVVIGGAFSALTLFRKGSSLNYLFEVFVLASSLSYILFVRLGSIERGVPAHRWGWLAGGLLLSTCIFPLAQITMHRMGPMERASRDDLVQKTEFARFLIALPKPLLITDEIWNLPWFASEKKRLLVKPDPLWYPDALKKGLIRDGGINGLIQRHWYASIYVEKNSNLYQAALDSGYHTVPLLDQFTKYKDSLGHEVVNCSLLAAPVSSNPSE